MGGERAKERASERRRRDISGRGEQEENVCTTRKPPIRLLRAANRSSGRVSALVALPYPCPALPCLVCHHRQTNRHREKKRKRERRAKRKRLHCKKTTQTVAAGHQQVQWAGVCLGHPALPCPVCHHRQTDKQHCCFYI